MGTGTGGLWVVSWTSKYCVCDEPSGEGNTSVIGTLAKFYAAPQLVSTSFCVCRIAKETSSLRGYRWIRSS